MLLTITKKLTGLALRLMWCLLALFMLLSASWAQAAKITILLSDMSADYRNVADAIMVNLAAERKAGLDIEVLSQAEWQNAEQAKNSALIVAVGVSAVQAAVDSKTRIPVLATLIPKQTFEKIAGGKGMEAHRMTGLYLDQPFERQLYLIRAILPRAQSFGALLSPQTQGLSVPLRSVAERFQFAPVLSTINGEGELFPQLMQVLPQVDAMLAIPDNNVLNRQTIRNFLLATYRNRVPVIGYSQSQVEAGVLASVFSTPAQIGQQGGEMVRQILKGTWPTPAYPRYFTVKVNNSVARSLNIALPDEETLQRDVRKMTGDD